MAVNIKLLKKEEDKAVYLVKGVDAFLLNILRRSIMEEVPVMAIEDVTFIKNTSALYDEILAHRIGLLPLSTDLASYNIMDECKCKGKGCNRCQLKLILEANGPSTVYAENIKSKDPKVKPVYTKMPIIRLLKGQQLQCEMTAKLGRGREHAKFSPGLVYYRGYPIFKFDKIEQAKKCIDALENVLVLKGKELEVNDILNWNEGYENVCEMNNVEVDYSKEDFLFYVESWGQLEITKMIDVGIDLFNKKLGELTKELK